MRSRAQLMAAQAQLHDVIKTLDDPKTWLEASVAREVIELTLRTGYAPPADSMNLGSVAVTHQIVIKSVLRWVRVEDSTCAFLQRDFFVNTSTIQ